MFKLSHILVKCTKNTARIPSLTRLQSFSSSPTFAEAKNISIENVEQEVSSSQPPVHRKPEIRSNNTMIAAAFASLQAETPGGDIKTPFTDDKLNKATTIEELLSISEGTGVSRRHALKVVSVLSDWSTSGKVKLADFESDPRFIRLCKILTKGAFIKSTRANIASRSDDLSTILSVTADDEAAKLVASITLPQMVKVMTTLAQKRRRSTLLLRALSYNITASTDKMDLKQCADLLYSMSMLNFPDENLLSRVSHDVVAELEGDVRKSAAVGSVVTSIGLLKYKSSMVLDAISEWTLKNHSICRPQDIFSVFMTFAVLDYTPANAEEFFKVLVPQLTPSEAGKPLAWLDIVWSLVLLGQADEGHVSSVLNEEFINLIDGKKMNISSMLKLLNIDGAAQYLVKNYKGPKLVEILQISDMKVSRTKEKQEMVDAVVDSVKNLIQNENNLRTSFNTGMGFYIDAECMLDKKMNPVPLNTTKTEDLTKVAIIAYDYHDMSRGRLEPTGINTLATKLLEAQNYKVLTIPYADFKPRDKLVHRVKYIETKLKEIVKC